MWCFANRTEFAVCIVDASPRIMPSGLIPKPPAPRVDPSFRSVKLTVNGVELESAFSESVTSIHYPGLGVQNAETLFTEPEIR